MEHVLNQFRNAARSRGLILPDDLDAKADGKVRRCDVDGGKRSKGDGAFLLHLDGVPAGGFENWRDGLGWENWKADIRRTFTQAEQAAHRARMEAAHRDRQAEDVRRRAEAQARAALIWAAARVGAHPYLVRKGIAAHGARLSRDKLVIPVRDAAGVLHSLQFIGADGSKKFLRGGRVDGGYFSIGGKPADVLCVAEGFATGASIHQATGHPVAVAFNAGNLEAVARALRDKLPAIRLVICADDDRHTPGNPGLTKATAAARAVGAALALPAFQGAI